MILREEEGVELMMIVVLLGVVEEGECMFLVIEVKKEVDGLKMLL